MTTTDHQHALIHAPNCRAERQLDVVAHEARGITTTHCVDCGAHEARSEAGELIPPPASPGPFNMDHKPGLLDGITLKKAEDKR